MSMFPEELPVVLKISKHGRVVEERFRTVLSAIIRASEYLNNGNGTPLLVTEQGQLVLESTALHVLALGVEKAVAQRSTYRCNRCRHTEDRGGVCGSTGYFDGSGYVPMDVCPGIMEPL